MRVAILSLLGIVLIALPGVTEAQSNAPQDSAASDGSGPCIPVLPEPDFSPSAAIRANRERSIREGAGEVNLPWFLPQENAARNRAMPMWMRKISKVTLDRVLLLKEKDLLVHDRRHLAVQYSTGQVPVDSLARLMVRCKAKTRQNFDEEFFASIGGHLVRSVRDPGHPDSSIGFLNAWVPPEYLRCLAENPEVVWIEDCGVIVTHDTLTGGSP